MYVYVYVCVSFVNDSFFFFIEEGVKGERKRERERERERERKRSVGMCLQLGSRKRLKRVVQRNGSHEAFFFVGAGFVVVGRPVTDEADIVVRRAPRWR